MLNIMTPIVMHSDVRSIQRGGAVCAMTSPKARWRDPIPSPTGASLRCKTHNSDKFQGYSLSACKTTSVLGGSKWLAASGAPAFPVPVPTHLAWRGERGRRQGIAQWRVEMPRTLA
jgi:hypothetical protein